MTVTYEIRTIRNTPVHAYDNEQRARQALREARQRVGGLRLFKVTRSEEEIA